MSAINCLMRKISSCEAKVNYESKLLNAYTRLGSVVGASNRKYYNCGTLPSRVPVWKIEHGSTA